MPWVRKIINKSIGGQVMDAFDSSTIAAELEIILLEVFGSIIIQEMFSIIIGKLTQYAMHRIDF